MAAELYPLLRGGGTAPVKAFSEAVLQKKYKSSALSWQHYPDGMRVGLVFREM